MGDVTIKAPAYRNHSSLLQAQGHHHNDDQAIRRPHILRLICGRRSRDLDKVVRLFIGLLHGHQMCSEMHSIGSFRLSPTIWLKFERCTFWTTGLQLGGIYEVRWGSFDSLCCVPISSALTQSLALTAFELFCSFQKRFRLSIRPRYDNNHCSRSHRFVEQQTQTTTKNCPS